jgi:hypothetical protein
MKRFSSQSTTNIWGSSLFLAAEVFEIYFHTEASSQPFADALTA